MLRVGAGSPSRGLAHEPRAHLKLDRDVHFGFSLANESAPPGREVVDPRFEGVLVSPELFDAEFAPLPVFTNHQHRRFDPLLFTFPAMEHDSCDDGLVFRKHVGLDNEALAHDGFGWKAAAVDFGANTLDDNALRKLPGCRTPCLRYLQ